MTSASHVEGLNCDLLYDNLVPLLPLKCLASVLRPPAWHSQLPGCRIGHRTSYSSLDDSLIFGDGTV